MKPKLLVILLMTLFLGCSHKSESSQGYTITSIQQTHDLENGLLQFTISPNSEWMIYVKNLSYKENEPNYLIVLSLQDYEKYELEITFDEAIGFLDNANECWSNNSMYCVYPSLVFDFAKIYPEIIIEINGTSGPRIIRQTSWNISEQKIKYTDLQPDELFTCSDCGSSALKKNEHGLMEMYVPSVQFSTSEQGANHLAENIMSQDGSKIYYQTSMDKKLGKIGVALYEFDVETQAEKEIASFFFRTGSSAFIQGLRLSPNQKYLAMTVTHKITPAMISDDKRYILDLETGILSEIPGDAFGTPKWNLQSNRLYFYDGRGVNVLEH